jgi:23S rRNA (cytidine1920-2'-O)/16S rRNA (cytidine1409-2'-O)-methyltransferase
MRLDQVLVARGLAVTRSRAQDLIERGCVTVGGQVAGKPAQQIRDENVVILVADEPASRISRGGLKLAAALAAFDFDAAGKTALDIGASTGGFTDVLLQRGARRVYAIDVGRGQLHTVIKDDPRVVSLEERDARDIDPHLIPEPIDVIVADVSFISLTKVLCPALDLARAGAWLAALIKPQFEAGRAAIGSGGIVRDPAERERAVAAVRGWLVGQSGWRVVGVIPSPVLGRSGNEEFLIGAIRE